MMTKERVAWPDWQMQAAQRIGADSRQGTEAHARAKLKLQPGLIVQVFHKSLSNPRQASRYL